MSDNKKPNIRFKGYSDDWEQRKFGEVLETVTDYVAAGSFADLAKNVEYKDYPDYAQLIRTKDLKNGFTSTQEVYVNKNAFDYLYRVNMDKECIILPNIGNCGEVYYVKPESLPYEHNVLGPNAIFVRSETCANNFLSILFQAKDFQTKLKLIVSPNGQTKFNKTELKGIDLILPRDVYEQEKIGQYFSNLDRLITLHQRKYNKLQTLKKAMLEKMFPKNGSNVPEIRFKGFTDAWEQRKAIDIADYSKGNGYSKGDLIDVGTPIILYGRLYTKYQFAISEVDTFAVPRNGAVYSQGNEVIVPASGETAEDIARASAVEKSGVLLGGDLNILRPFDFINPLFLALAISNGEPQKELAKKAQGKSVVHIHNTDIQEVTIAYPSRTEQDRIVSVFRQLDHLITLHQRELEKLQNIKKAMLEKMFV